MLQLARRWTDAAAQRQPSKDEAQPTRDPRTDFATLPAYAEMRRMRAIADVMEIDSPYFRLHETRSGAECVIDGKTFVNFSSYDYLGLNGSAPVIAAAKDAIDTFGTSVSASRPTAGERRLHRDLEAQLARLYGTDDALSFVSGHATNVSVVGELLGSSDLVLYDALCHNSVVVGTKLSNATRRSFPHNDARALDRILAETRHRYDRVLVVAEGLYSMDGDVAALPDLIAVKTRHHAWLMVDEAHSLGVLGATGRGVFEHFGLPPTDVDIWMGTLSKTAGACGGYIAGCRALIENLKFNASAFMFSVGMSPPVAAAARAALQTMLEQPERVRELQQNGKVFLEAARAAGLDTGSCEGHAIGVIVIGDSLRTAALANRLFQRGINTMPVTYPAVPMRGARLRFFLTSVHRAEQIRESVAAVAEELEAMNREGFGVARAATAMRAAAEDVTGATA